MESSSEHNLDASTVDSLHITRNCFDLMSFISRFIRSEENSNPLSLLNYLKVFGKEFEGKQHSALDDAMNLVRLYSCLNEQPTVLEKEYKKVLAKQKHLPPPISNVITRLANGVVVTPEDFENEIREFLK